MSLTIGFRSLLLVGVFSLASASGAVAGTIATFNTSLGSFQVELFDSATPITVANFLKYVNDGDYNGTFIHRVATLNGQTTGTPFVVQGGGYKFSGTSADHIPTDPPIVNEFSATRPNVRGTLAMAKTSDPNSATSEWFINTTDNPFLDSPSNSGGFTTFGKVLGNGMQVVDAIAALQRINAGGAFATLPVRGTVGSTILAENLVTLTSITVPEPTSLAVALLLISVTGLFFARRLKLLVRN